MSRSRPSNWSLSLYCLFRMWKNTANATALIVFFKFGWLTVESSIKIVEHELNFLESCPYSAYGEEYCEKERCCFKICDPFWHHYQSFCADVPHLTTPTKWMNCTKMFQFTLTEVILQRLDMQCHCSNWLVNDCYDGMERQTIVLTEKFRCNFLKLGQYLSQNIHVDSTRFNVNFKSYNHMNKAVCSLQNSRYKITTYMIFIRTPSFHPVIWNPFKMSIHNSRQKYWKWYIYQNRLQSNMNC